MNGRIYLLLQKKDEYPNQDDLGLPGKIILPNEETSIALDKLLQKLIGTTEFYKKQLNAFSDVARHPLGRVVSLTYYGLIPFEKLSNPVSSKLEWHLLDEIPQLCYDHNKIVEMIINRFRKGLLRHPRVFEFLPKEFTLSDIINIYKQAFDTVIDASNFGKQIIKSNLIKPLNKLRKDAHDFGRPAKLYEFNKSNDFNPSKNKVHFNF